MKRKLLVTFLSVICAACLCLGLTACGNGSGDETSDWQNGIYSVQTAYAEAQELGYSGTLQEFIASISGTDGKDGVGISSITINEDGKFVITYTDGNTDILTLPSTSVAQYTLEYKENESGYTVTGISDKEATAVEIPAEYNGKPVTTIGSKAFANCYYLTEVTIPNTITCIEDYAFYNCFRLESISLPDKLETIEDCAFANCSSLEEITFPDSLKYLGGYVLYGCDLISSVTLSFGFSGKVGKINCFIYLFGAQMIDSTTVNSSAIVVHPTLVSVTVNGDIVPEYAFGLYCPFVKDVIISDSVTSIGNSAFSSCTALTSITIPDSVTSIENSAFYSCTALTSITIPNSVTSIGIYAFSNCTALTSITIPDSVTSISNRAFYDCTALTSITIGNGVTSIGDSTFYDCTALKNVYYNGTTEEWNEISISSYNNYYLTSATIYYYSESEPSESGNYWHYVDGVIAIWGDGE